MEEQNTINDILKVVQKQKDDTKDILKIVHFLRDNAVTQTEFRREVTGIKGDITGIKGDITLIKATMVTKEYLDTKLADLKGEMVSLTRREDNKLKAFIKMIEGKKVISDSDSRKLLTMEPFAELAV